MMIRPTPNLIHSLPLGIGDYFYRLCVSPSPNELKVIKVSDLNAGNYAGAGVFTVNPIVATIG